MASNTPKSDKARAYILAHPDESKSVQAAGAGCSEQLIAEMRRALIAEGKLAPSRKAMSVTDVPLAPAPPAGMLDHQAMQALADIASLEDLDDEEVQKRMLKQCVKFAFDTNLHADTRMTASVQWGKLRDAVRTKDLGPGPPLTREAARGRLADLQKSIADVDLVVEALFRAYPAAVLFPALNAVLGVSDVVDSEAVVAANPSSSPA
jgi:hypothetical protein